MKKDIFTARAFFGNRDLWKEPKIAFFASNDANENVLEKIRCWSRNQAKNGVCFIGAFHSEAESALFHATLRNGGKAIQILGKDIPETFSRDEQKAFDENRLLVISCFHREKYTRATSLFANHVAAMHAEAVVFAHISEKSRLFPFYKRLLENRKADVTRVK